MRSKVIIPVGVLLATMWSSQLEAHDHACLPATCDPPVFAHASVDPRFELVRSQLTQFGSAAPFLGPGITGVVPDAIPASLRFDRILDPRSVEAIASSGIEFIRHPDGDLSRVGKIYRASVPLGSVSRLRELPHLIRAEVEWSPILLSPLEVTGDAVGASAARLRPDELAVDGSGTLIANIDSGVDIFHPHFFFADGGYFEWLDVDENQRFDPGVDAVDLDRDGEDDLNETLRLLDATFLDRRDTSEFENDDDILQPRLDWLYADQNSDRERNRGREAGFTEEDGAYGEAIFVVDDVDRDGVLEPGEKLVRLGTSKIRKVVIGERVYRRGQNLIDLRSDERFSESNHGTGVMSIALGGQAGFHNRAGLAPGAEGLVYVVRRNEDVSADFFDESGQIAAIEDAILEGADLILHEWTNPFAAPQDGSTNVEAAMDQARLEGVAQINPLGNLNLSEKHIESSLAPGNATELDFEVEGAYELRGETFPYSIVYLSLQWLSSDDLSLTVVNPEGVEVPIVYGADPISVGAEDSVQATLDLTPRASRHAFLMLWSSDTESQSVMQGTWKIRIEGASSQGKIFGRVSDFFSGWSPGVRWAEPTSGTSTAVHPATADSALGVAAFAGRSDDLSWDMSRRGELRNYSGRGPRFDGLPLADIAAPDDPFAALAATDALLDVGWGQTWFASFGGTSGAGPHVAATYALLREAYPSATVDELEARIRNGARVEMLEPDLGAPPNRGWGAGKLDAYRAIYDADPPRVDGPPVVMVEAMRADEMLRVDASASRDPQELELSFRFDLGYDGVWETEWQSSPVYEAETEANLVRLEVRNAGGASAGAIVSATAELDGSMEPGAPDMGNDGTPGAPPEHDGCSAIQGEAKSPLLGLLALGMMGVVRRRRGRI